MAERLTERKTDHVKGQLDALPLEQACTQYANYLDTFQVDLPMAISFINRMLAAGTGTLDPTSRQLMEQAVKAAVFLAPFETDILKIGIDSGIFPNLETVRKVLEATNAEPAVYEEVRRAPLKHHAEEIRKICHGMLAKHPMHILFADLLLGVDLFEAKRPDPVLDRFNCPKVVRPLWNKRLFNHAAAMGDDVLALPMWEATQPMAQDDPFTLSRAAEMLRRQGDLEGCKALYAMAIQLDSATGPYAQRLHALEHPFQPDHSLIHSKKVCIYLYCYNKADILAETLESLATSDIGPARIKILLNGCTDHSRDAAATAHDLFPENEVEIIELPVNIGAPAARNWLISQPATWESDYVAFLDDDVFVQKDWLAHFLTVAESDPKIGNVGCKVVFPGEFRMLQYLHRYVSQADEDVIRVSLPTPFLQYDTGLYDVVRETRVVMGCQHLLRVEALKDAPWFDIRYSPSQIDDTDHDLQLCLAGWKVYYCGAVTCVHRQGSGTSVRSKLNWAGQGNVMGNDLKFFYKWLDRCDELRPLDSLGCAR